MPIESVARKRRTCCANPSASSATDADIEEVIEIVSSGTELARLVVDDPDGVVAAAWPPARR
jgi:hypothetical protein